MIAYIVTIVKNFLVDNVTSLLYTSFHKEVICLTIGERIKSIREKLGITQEEFSQRLGTTRNTITNYEANRRMPMDATIKSICREFHVSEVWLRTGEGEMFTAVSRSEEIAGWIGNILTDEQADFKWRFVSVLARLTEDEWELIERKARELLAGQEKEEGGD